MIYNIIGFVLSDVSILHVEPYVPRYGWLGPRRRTDEKRMTVGERVGMVPTFRQ